MSKTVVRNETNVYNPTRENHIVDIGAMTYHIGPW